MSRESLRVHRRRSSAARLLPVALSLAMLATTAHAQSSGPSLISVLPADWFQDAFPFNETPNLPALPAFDTTSALIVSGRNIAQLTGNLQRFDVPGDTIVATCAGAAVRMDLVFRVKPGVGNYRTVGSPASGLRRVPTSTVAVSPGDGSWWGTWLADPGEFATSGAAARDAAWPGGWNPNVWRSARCDTAQMNLFPVDGAGVGPALDPMRWMSTYHESDPHLAALGIPRRECFLVDTLGPANATNITCSTVPPWVTADPVRAGYDGDPLTVEGTKIFPDGLLTPGAHVQYFWRASDASAPATMLRMCPDTTRVWPQPGEGSYDGHRWQQFGVLPDRWKDVAYGGSGMACVLVVDVADRRGDELAWVSIADSASYTASVKYGAHNGWHARGDADVNDPSGFIAAHGGQPGTTWDLYQVRAGEDPTGHSGDLGGRISYRDPSPLNLVHGKYARIAPTPEMMETFYKFTMVLTGDLSSGVLGPFNDHSQDDLGFLTTYLQGATLGSPRGLVIFGDGYAEATVGDPFLTDVLGLDLLYSSYSELSGNATPVLTLKVSADLSPPGNVYGLRNTCSGPLCILSLNTALPEATEMVWYPPIGAGFIAAVLKKANATRPWIAASHGFGIQRLVTPFGDNTRARIAYFFNLSKNIFGSFCTVGGFWASVPGDGPAFTDGLRLLGVPMTRGSATLEFTLAAPDRVSIGLYDVGGRLVRSFTERAYPAGVQKLAWDGADDSGRRMSAGVYFARVRYAARGFEGVRKIVVLK